MYIYIYIYTLEESPPLEPLGPHFGDLGHHFGSILAPFWQPLGTLGTTLGAIGHHLGNLVDPRVKITSSSSAQVRFSLQFGVDFGGHFLQKLHNFIENWLPKTIPQPNAFCIRFLCNFSDPRTLIFELSPARERDFQKTT